MRWSGSRGALVAAAGPPAAAAVLGNAFIGKASMRWFRELDPPRFQLPMPAFAAVGMAYYVQLAVVLYRAWRTDNSEMRNRALLVLAGNELWNATFFGLRSTRNGFLGTLVFVIPLLRLQRSVTGDPAARAALTPYTVWVIGYDLPWTYALWRRNHAKHLPVAIAAKPASACHGAATD